MNLPLYIGSRVSRFSSFIMCGETKCAFFRETFSFLFGEDLGAHFGGEGGEEFGVDV